MTNFQSGTSYEIDMIVVGAGSIGLPTARALGDEGVHVRVFEERTRPQPQSTLTTSGSFGMLP